MNRRLWVWWGSRLIGFDMTSWLRRAQEAIPPEYWIAVTPADYITYIVTPVPAGRFLSIENREAKERMKRIPK